MIANRRAFDFHLRLALAFAPLTLGLFALGVADARRRACFANYTLMNFSRFEMHLGPFEVGEHVPAIVAAWGPNLTWCSWRPHSSSGRFEGVSHLQQTPVISMTADDLQTDRQSLWSEAARH